MTHNPCTDLFDVVGVLLHGDLFHCALKAKEVLDVQAGVLLKARPAGVLGVHLQHETSIITSIIALYPAKKASSRRCTFNTHTGKPSLLWTGTAYKHNTQTHSTRTHTEK